MRKRYRGKKRIRANLIPVVFLDESGSNAQVHRNQVFKFEEHYKEFSSVKKGRELQESMSKAYQMMHASGRQTR